MALMDRFADPDRVSKCYLGHVDCAAHKAEKPNLAELAVHAGTDTPRSGKCACGEVGYLWQLPRDSTWVCKRCLRGTMRRATWPFTIRFPDEK